MKINKTIFGEYDQKLSNVRLTVLYDSVAMAPGLQTGLGFSCLAEVGDKKVLFDTGSDGEILLSNMYQVGIDPKEIDIVLISHSRFGHIGGLDDFLNINNKAPVFIPESFPENSVERIKKTGAEVKPVFFIEELLPNIFTLGEFVGIFREQVMAIRTSKGIVVIVGCAHHVSITILYRTKVTFPNDPIYLVLGGFHFSGLSDSEQSKILKTFLKLRVQNVAPCHCCEESCRKRFQLAYSNNYIEMGVGGIIGIGEKSSSSHIKQEESVYERV